jgi:alpha-L-fucosidase
MRTRFLTVALALALAGCASNSSSNSSPKPQPSQATTAADDSRMEWWRDARFGMFIHWGLYSIPAGKWGDHDDYAEWIRQEGKIPVSEYEKLLPRFNPVKFDADKIAAAAADAGCKYIVITTKHHDGFCLFDSKYTDWDVMSTPFHRDIMKELSAATRRHGLTQCWYHSIMDWHHPDYLPRRDWEEKDRPAAGADFDRYNQYLKNQVTELLTNYGPIGVMWFDGEWENTWTPERGEDLYALCRRVQPSVIVNNRVGKARDGMAGLTKAGEHAVGDFGTPEQEIPATGLPGVDWETCMTMNDHWGYNAVDKNFKSTEDLVRKLCDIASKGGNFLLNVGPTSEGEIPPESLQRLHEIGLWMRVNGEAIYGTQASPLADLDFGRCTMKSSARGERTTLYLHVFDWPPDEQLRLEGLGNQPLRACLLADRSRTLTATRDGSAVRISLPGSRPDAICSVVALEIAGKPIVYPTPQPTAAADTFVNSTKVTFAAPPSGTTIRYTTDGHDPSAADAVFDRPFLRVDKTTTVKARLFKDGQAVSGMGMHSFDKVDAAPAANVTPADKGLTRTIFKGDWDKLPDFGTMQAESTSVVTEIAPPDKAKKEEHIGYRFTGYLQIPADDVYQFVLNSDDGARLSIDGKVVVDHDGTHGATDKTGTAPLAKGWHAITVDWFNKTGNVALSLKMAAAGDKPKEIPAESFAH